LKEEAGRKINRGLKYTFKIGFKSYKNIELKKLQNRGTYFERKTKFIKAVDGIWKLGFLSISYAGA